MRDFNTIQLDAVEPGGGELKAACEHMVRELVDGVRHGFFEMIVTVETGQSKRNPSRSRPVRVIVSQFRGDCVAVAVS
jgi:hypothetical protein